MTKIIEGKLLSLTSDLLLIKNINLIYSIKWHDIKGIAVKKQFNTCYI